LADLKWPVVVAECDGVAGKSSLAILISQCSKW
jgi:hypothetical protein